MNAVQEHVGQGDAAPAPRRKKRMLRFFVFALVVGVVGFGTRALWWEDLLVPVIKPAARDYLSFRRVHKLKEVIQTASAESGVDPT